MKGKISVVIPTLNRKEVLIETLNCLWRQQFENFEVILVDQTPRHPEEVERALREMAQRENFVWLRAQGGWTNLPAARNRGIEVATGEIVSFLDDDVILDGDYLGNLWQAYQDSGADSVVGPVLLTPDEKVASAREGVAKEGDPLAVMESRWLEGGGRGCNMSFRKEVLGTGGEPGGEWFDARFAGNAILEESDVFQRLEAGGKRVWLEAGIPVIHLAERAGGCREATFKDGKRLPKHFPLFFHNHILLAYKEKGFLGGMAAGVAQFRLLLRDEKRSRFRRGPLLLGALLLGMGKFAITTMGRKSDWEELREANYLVAGNGDDRA
jgi:hypothetical protein